jgi:putative membrane protein
MVEFLHLLIGTVQLRPYVFAFLTVYLVAATAHIGLRRTLLYIPLGYSIAWLSEFASIHVGFPYGDYFYIPDTMGKELWVLGVPFMDSLSYVFLSYCSFSTAVFLLSPVTVKTGRPLILEPPSIRRSWKVLVLGSFLFVLLDIIIDPVALQGHRWFLGQIYGYRHPGLYFGIPMSNFAGWLIVGLGLVASLQLLDRVKFLKPQRPSVLSHIPGICLLGPILYVSVPVFNLTVTFMIGEKLMGITGCLILFFPALLSFLFTIYKHGNITPEQIRLHSADFPPSEAGLSKLQASAEHGSP